MNYGERLKFARQRAGMTQGKLAEVSGVGQGSISKIERGDQDRSVHDIALAKALGVDPVWLATGAGPMPAGAMAAPAYPTAVDAALLRRAICEIESAFSILGTKPTIEQKAEAIIQRYEALVAGAEGSGDVSTLAVAS